MAVPALLLSLSGPQRRRFTFTVLGFMGVAAAGLVGRTAGDALFLTRYGAGALASMYVATALVVGGVSAVYARLAGRLPLSRLIPAATALIALMLVALRLALAWDWGGFRVAAYILADLVVNLPMLLFWSFAALTFDPREAKRLFGYIGAGGTLACIVAGFVVRPFAAAFGAANLLPVVAALLVGFGLSVRHLARREGVGTQAPGGRGTGPGAGVLRSPQVRVLVLLTLASTVVLTLVDYQFKAAVRGAYQGRAMAGFFGTFYGASSAVAMLIQVFLVHRILQKGGVFLGLLLMPAGLLVASAGTFATGSFDWTVATKLVFQVLAFTVDGAALQMLYLGVPAQSRSQARAFVDGIGKPVAMAVTGLVLAVLIGGGSGGQGWGWLERHHLAAAAAALAGLWLLLTRLNHRAYVAALVESLGSHRLDVSAEHTAVLDRAFESRMREALTSAGDDDVEYLVEMLPAFGDVDWAPEHRALLLRPSARVKVAALSYLEKEGTEEDAAAAVALFGHEDPAVRLAAVRAAAAKGGRDAVEEVEALLADSDPDVRGAAVAALINSGDLDRLLSAGAVLRDMLSAGSAESRAAAARALSAIRRGGLSRPIIGLLQDADPGVVRAALKASCAQKDPDLIPAVVPLLSRPETAHAAADALAVYGMEALDHLIPYLELDGREGAFAGAVHIPDVLARTLSAGTPGAGPLTRRILSALRDGTASADPDLRAASIDAYVRAVSAQPDISAHRDDIQTAARREIAASVRRSEWLHAAAAPGAEVLSDALKAERARHLRSAFALLGLLTSGVDMPALLRGLATPAGRANALEVLDNVLPGPLRAEVLAAVGETHGRPGDGRRGRLADVFVPEAGEWVRIGALFAAARIGDAGALGPARDALCAGSAVLRETALFALSKLDPPSATTAAARLADDPDPAVRRLAKDIVSVGV